MPLKYIDADGNSIEGYGFPNPTAADAIVFTATKPEGTTKDWKSVKVRYVELYKKDNLIDALKEVMGKRYVDSLVPKEKQEKAAASAEIDTVKLYYLRKMKGAVGNGLNELVYDYGDIRVFRALNWKGYYAIHDLIFIQTGDASVYDSDTYFLNYNNEKAFKRSAERIFSDCPKLLEQIEAGNYYPKLPQHYKKLAKDYLELCKG
ncbi:hypothetical protein [Leeuwenhoekiella nanhaiensis]|uniref:Uncharacterized protein n=1 Tax=Leeuwenhoekiella nanhaiensis TaxID=1655491 RepID=A0A2G1VN40_9FLAO|nr:hypothetical protein [Leeuwenhoekiella nanhaiensis]PHQ27899.1 hypothetical protein CJ305_17685 [Leeuwenhoekiella nanhaiensis]